MATIAATNMQGSGAKTVTETTLAGADTFTYSSGADPVLVLRNPTAGALTPVIDGDAASSVSVSGAGSFDISGGYSVGSIAAGSVKSIRLRTIERYLAGTISVSGGAGLVGSLLEF
jgi:hypothetical protein